MLRKLTGRLAVVACLTGPMMVPPDVRAQDTDIASFYKDKQVTVFIGYGPGGGYDLYARTMSKYLPQHIPGNPRVLNMNMPGASTIKLGTHLHSTAPRDGTAFGIVNPALLLDAVFYEKSTVPFNPAELTLIGNASNSAMLLVAWHTAGVNTLEDLKTKELTIGATSRTGDTFILPQAIKNILGLKLKIIMGYPGTREALIALESGELSGRVWNYESIKATRMDWVRDGTIKVVSQLSLERHPEFPNVPLASEAAKNEEDRKALEIIFLSTEFARPFVAPPKMPAMQTKALRDAFMATMRDPGFIADIEKQQLEISPMSAEEMEGWLKQAYEAPPNLIKRIRTALAD
jgi:tripartite-type tricarboxylate transporter receptor subunit TctC